MPTLNLTNFPSLIIHARARSSSSPRGSDMPIFSLVAVTIMSSMISCGVHATPSDRATCKSVYVWVFTAFFTGSDAFAFPLLAIPL